MKTVINNTDLHFEHHTWKGETALWRDELKSFEKRLAEIEERWTRSDVLGRLEQFQNEFRIHKDRIYSLIDAVEAHENVLAMAEGQEEEALDRQGYLKHSDIRERMETERLMYADLKKRFFAFLSRTL